MANFKAKLVSSKFCPLKIIEIYLCNVFPSGFYLDYVLSALVANLKTKLFFKIRSLKLIEVGLCIVFPVGFYLGFLLCVMVTNLQSKLFSTNMCSLKTMEVHFV